ncbi:MAG: TolB-like protein/class 3 adenylate cyclase/Flp pilus assembly protein TadD [Paracoccaceae bacterium]|jgi:TolB-like protein/class 3 adenylate cyclase/Flp pilus assembly protein TadD
MTGEIRRLAAIVAADVAGYSRLMGVDEEGTIAALRGHRQAVIEPKLEQFHGRIANTAGDSFLIEFPSAVDALRCAIDIQAGIAARNVDIPEDRQLILRIGINVGDVVANGDDLLGDGVNVAARLEGLADSGGICLSRSARDQVRDRLDIALEDLGEIEVKNIARPVRAFKVAGIGRKAPPSPKRSRVGYAAIAAVLVAVAAGGAWWFQQGRDASVTAAGPGAASSQKPSIAVLPFSNSSGDKGQAYFADGITQDITTDLSKVAGLFVTSRSATLKYRDGAQDPKSVATALGVRHILTGSVRRAGSKIRITATLIDAETGGQLWAERFDRDTRDVFAIQDEISGRVVRQLSETLRGVSLKRVERTYTPNVEAYDLYMKGRAERIPPTPPNLKSALAKFEKAIEIDPGFAGGYAGASFARALIHAAWGGNTGAGDMQLDQALKLGKKAVEIDPEFGPAWGSLAEAYFRKGRHDDALEAIRKAIAAAPSDSLMRARYGRFLGYVRRSSEGIEQVREAMRMSPDSLPLLYFLALNYRAAGEFDKAIEALREHRKRLGGRILPAPTCQLIAALIQAGRKDEARAEAQGLLAKLPKYTARQAARSHVYKVAEDSKQFVMALREAGLPE